MAKWLLEEPEGWAGKISKRSEGLKWMGSEMDGARKALEIEGSESSWAGLAVGINWKLLN